MGETRLAGGPLAECSAVQCSAAPRSAEGLSRTEDRGQSDSEQDRGQGMETDDKDVRRTSCLVGALNEERSVQPRRKELEGCEGSHNA